MREYPGRCSCGQVEVRLQSGLSPSEFQPRSDAPTCRFCRERDGVWISDPNGTVDLPSADRTLVHRFASRQVEFHACRRCDDLVYALFEDPLSANRVAVVRLGLFESIRAAARPPMTTHFDGEAPERGRERRLENWTPVRP